MGFWRPPGRKFLVLNPPLGTKPCPLLKHACREHDTVILLLNTTTYLAHFRFRYLIMSSSQNYSDKSPPIKLAFWHTSVFSVDKSRSRINHFRFLSGPSEGGAHVLTAEIMDSLTIHCPHYNDTTLLEHTEQAAIFRVSNCLRIGNSFNNIALKQLVTNVSEREYS